MKYFRALIGVLAIATTALSASAEPLVTYNFTTDFSPSGVSPLITASSVTLSGDFARSGGAQNLFLRGIHTPDSLAAAISNSPAVGSAAPDYVQFTLTPTGSNMVSFETIVFDHAGSNALATSFSSSFSVFASLNGFSSNPAAGDAFGTSTVTITPTPSGSSQTFATGVTFSFGSAFQNLTSASTVTFRIYGFDNSDSNDQIPRVDNIQVTGSAVPEPSTYVLLGVAMLGLVAFRRRRVA